MDKQVLESTRAVSDTTNYAMAVFHDKELHITPLQGIVYLRPSFGYLDLSDKRAREEAKEQGEGKNFLLLLLLLLLLLFPSCGFSLSIKSIL